MIADHSLVDTLLAGVIPSDVLVSIAAAGTHEAETAPPHVAQYALAFIHVCVNLRKYRQFVQGPCRTLPYVIHMPYRKDTLQHKRSKPARLLGEFSAISIMF